MSIIGQVNTDEEIKNDGDIDRPQLGENRSSPQSLKGKAQEEREIKDVQALRI